MLRGRVAVAGAAGAAFFFLRARGAPPGRLLVSFLVFDFPFALLRFYLGVVPGVARCVSVSMAVSLPVLRGASLFFFFAALKKSLKFFPSAFKQRP